MTHDPLAGDLAPRAARGCLGAATAILSGLGAILAIAARRGWVLRG